MLRNHLYLPRMFFRSHTYKQNTLAATVYTSEVQSTMELSYLINLIFIFVLNVLFFFSGICLNSLVIVTFWRSVQLRKKLCHFMIMILSCCDLVAVLTSHPSTAAIAMFWLTGKVNRYPSWVDISSDIFLPFSLLALLVMNFDRYLATYYPLFHRTSVTKRKLLTLFGILSIIEVALPSMSVSNVISDNLYALIFLIFVGPPMVFINYKLFIIARKTRRNNGIPPRTKKTFSFKNISSCLLAVACFVVLYIPVIICIGFAMASKNTPMLCDKVKLARLWARTSLTMNSTFNCLIFFWKNKILRTEGMKLIKSMKICRSRSEHQTFFFKLLSGSFSEAFCSLLKIRR